MKEYFARPQGQSIFFYWFFIIVLCWIWIPAIPLIELKDWYVDMMARRKTTLRCKMFGCDFFVDYCMRCNSHMEY